MRKMHQTYPLPELAVRRYLHARGLRFALHSGHLPGTPDIVLPRRRSVVFVHGCFWHGHDCSHGAMKAKHNSDFWQRKIAANRQRDERKAALLRAAGWFVETLWECEVADEACLERLARRLLRR